MTDKFEYVKKDEVKKKSTPLAVQMAIDELEALSGDNFKAGNLIAHYTLNTAIEIVKKHAG